MPGVLWGADPVQWHFYLGVWGNIFNSTQGRIFCRYTFSQSNILCIRIHHGTFDGKWRKILMGQGQETPEKSGFRIPVFYRDILNHGIQIVNRQIVMVGTNKKCRKHTTEKKQ